MAASHQVVITLTALNCPDEFRKRVITLTPALTNIQIGRSSKSEVKNLTAAKDNAWFDSPVMSREHAKLWISPPESRSVYLRDVGSMHGTFVQDRRLEKNVAHRLKDGDTVTFGIQVTRAQETFPAKVFRVKYEWQEWIPPTPESNSPAQSSHNVAHYAMPDGTPDAELSHEPSIRFHWPSSRGSSMPKSDSSVAGSVAEDDLNDDDDDDELEALRQVAEGSPSPTHVPLQASGGLTKEAKATDQDLYSNMARNGQTSPRYTARDGVGDSEHNPIQLDNDIRVQGVVVDESDDEGPEVVSSLKACDVVLPKHQAVPLPYGYVLETAAAQGHPNNFTVDIGHDSDEFEVADMSDEDDLESSNKEGTGYDFDIHEKESSPTHLGQDRVYQSTYAELDEEDEEEASSSIAETEEEAIAPSKKALPSSINKDGRKGSPKHLDTLQAISYPALLVEHTQCQTHSVPEGSTSPILGVSNSGFHLHDQAVPAHPSVSERAPSPSDAAMAKTSSVKDSQLIRIPGERYNHGQNGATVMGNTFDDRTLFTSNQTVTSTEDFLRTPAQNPHSINYGTSREHSTTWQAPEEDQTHYNDGPFKCDAERSPALFAHPDRAPSLHAQATASSSQNPRGGASHLFYREYRAATTYDGSLNEELSRLPGHRELPADQYSFTPTNRLGSAMSYAAPMSTYTDHDQPESSPATTRATTGLSIGDIVETQSAQSPTPVLGIKRKADEISTDQDEWIGSPLMSQSSGVVSNVEDFSLPDAQPRDMSELATQLKFTQSTDTSSGSSRSTAPTATRHGRPKKRVKTVAKWIGTTILLGVGAIVTIVSTAPQSVWDEIDREMGLA